MSKPEDIGQYARERHVKHGEEAINMLRPIQLMKFRARAHKGDWDRVPIITIFGFLMDEVSELKKAIEERSAGLATSGDVINECADVANYAAMIADNLKRG